MPATLTTADMWRWSISIACLAAAAQAGADDWLHYGGDPGGRHYSPLQQIHKDNVDDLELAWSFRTGDVESLGDAMKNTSTQSTPILLPEAAGRSLVFCTPYDRVIALDPGRGEQRWEFDPGIDRRGDRPFRCRGVAYYEATHLEPQAACRHRLFLATHDRRLWAIDARSGAPCDSFGENGWVPMYGQGQHAPGEISNSSPPVIAAGKVIAGSAITDFTQTKTPRGIVAAYNADDGRVSWQFDPLDGHPGSGSANVWAPISVDEANGLVYLPTSAPSPDYFGGNRDGDNRYANSVVAVSIEDGSVRWHFQHVRHDLWDYDTPAQPILFEWQKGGESVPALAQLTKQGFVFVLDRLTGESLWEITEQPVPPSQIPGEQTARTQPKPIAPPPLIDAFLTPDDAWGLTFHDRDACREKIAALNNLGLFTPLSLEPTLMYPGSLGGPNWGGGALLEDRGLLITNVNNIAFTGRLLPSDQLADAQRESPELDHSMASSMHVTMHGTPYTVELGTLTSPWGMPCNPPPWGKLVAIDLVRGRISWEVPLGSVHEMGPVESPFRIHWGTPNLGGGIATGGGLFFIAATMDRQFRAFSIDTGDELWHYELDVDATATPMTYEHEGRQFVVVNAGGHKMFNRGYGDYLYAFALKKE